jgi:methylated-DNA-[protein]-cysteine S-methyltransferase
MITSENRENLLVPVADTEAMGSGNQLHFFSDEMTTPIGGLTLLSDEFGNLRAIDFAGNQDRLRLLLSRQYRSTQIAIEPRRNAFGLTSALESYFEGDVESIQSLPVLSGGTPFQQSVWQSLRLIPTGETVSYGSLAKTIGKPAAVRAVGLANGANPVSIVVPCHRVIGSDGSLTGYGGGLHRKRWLLDHERKYRKSGSSGQIGFEEHDKQWVERGARQDQRDQG